MKRAAPEISAPSPLRPRSLALIAAALLLAACTQSSPSPGSAVPRDGMGYPVDPVYGTSLPGTPMTSGAGM